MATVELNACRNELARDILATDDLDVLRTTRRAYRRAMQRRNLRMMELEKINAKGLASTQQSSQFGGDVRILLMQSCVVVDQDQDRRQCFRTRGAIVGKGPAVMGGEDKFALFHDGLQQLQQLV